MCVRVTVSSFAQVAQGKRCLSFRSPPHSGDGATPSRVTSPLPASEPATRDRLLSPPGRRVLCRKSFGEWLRTKPAGPETDLKRLRLLHAGPQAGVEANCERLGFRSPTKRGKSSYFRQRGCHVLIARDPGEQALREVPPHRRLRGGCPRAGAADLRGAT